MHCTIQTSDDVIVVTGGYNTFDFVTQYHLTDGTETPLTSMGQGRHGHACGVYQDTNGQQVLLVSGGNVPGGPYNAYLTSTEVAIYTDGSQTLEWRETGELPKARTGLRAALVDHILYVTAGEGDDFHFLSWNPSTETWLPAGELTRGRNTPAVIAVPSSVLSNQCSEM